MKGKTKTGHRVALYLRVSTAIGQTTENQRRELTAWAKRAGWPVVAVYEDAGISGAKGRETRPGLDNALNAAARREFDVLAAWSVDRLGRSLQDLIATLNELHALRIDLYLHQQAVDTTTPAGKAMFGMIGVFAEFERSSIRERVQAGLARAREAGRIGGRPRVPAEVEEAVRAELKKGTGKLKTARLIGCGVSVVQRVAMK